MEQLSLAWGKYYTIILLQYINNILHNINITLILFIVRRYAKHSNFVCHVSKYLWRLIETCNDKCGWFWWSALGISQVKIYRLYLQTREIPYSLCHQTYRSRGSWPHREGCVTRGQHRYSPRSLCQGLVTTAGSMRNYGHMSAPGGSDLNQNIPQWFCLVKCLLKSVSMYSCFGMSAKYPGKSMKEII